jgi:FkbM family methyltransferase
MKTVLVANKTYEISGLSETDVYFSMISDHFEADFPRLARRLIREDYVCLDIGANIGMKSLVMAQVAHAGKVIAVEAAPNVSAILEMNIKASGETNISVAKCAISDTDGEVAFVEDSAFGHIGGDGGKVTAKTIKTLLEDHDLSRLDFVKIDVEGFEYPILKNAIATINQHRALLLLEFNSLCQMVHADVSPKEFAQWLLASFEFVFVARTAPDGHTELERIHADGTTRLLYLNLAKDGSVTDIIATNAPERFIPYMDDMERGIKEREAEAKRNFDSDIAVARTEIAVARAEIESLKSELQAFQNTTSWRLTAPLRAIKKAFR